MTWEGTIIRQELYNAQLKSTKFIPVVFSSKDLIHAPIILNGNDKYVLEDEKSFRELCYRLRKEPTIAIPEVVTAKLQAPPEPKFYAPQKPQAEPPPVLLDVAAIQDPTAVQTVSADELASEKGIDYNHLQDLLKAGKWKEADQETAKRMLEVMGRLQEGYLELEDISNFPCTDLRTINRLWVLYSNGKFGFSVQKKTWQECGSPSSYSEEWVKFGEAVGWKKKASLA